MGAVVLLGLASQPVAAGSCYSVRVQGCGKKARVCVTTASSSDAETRAIQAFKDAYSCQSASVVSYSGSCSEAANDKCNLKI